MGVFYYGHCHPAVAVMVAELSVRMPLFDFHVQGRDYGREWGIAYVKPSEGDGRQAIVVQPWAAERFPVETVVRQIQWLWNHARRSTGTEVLEGLEFVLYNTFEAFLERYEKDWRVEAEVGA